MDKANASAANTMEYENALEAQMMEGHGPVDCLLHAVYTGEVNETVDGFLKFQLLKLGGAGSDSGRRSAAQRLALVQPPLDRLHPHLPERLVAIHLLPQQPASPRLPASG